MSACFSISYLLAPHVSLNASNIQGILIRLQLSALIGKPRRKIKMKPQSILNFFIDVKFCLSLFLIPTLKEIFMCPVLMFQPSKVRTRSTSPTRLPWPNLLLYLMFRVWHFVHLIILGKENYYVPRLGHLRTWYGLGHGRAQTGFNWEECEGNCF
jgi:hypothetical protein